MSLENSRLVRVKCDFPACERRGNYMSTASIARKDAESDAWSVGPAGDFCPLHSAAEINAVA